MVEWVGVQSQVYRAYRRGFSMQPCGESMLRVSVEKIWGGESYRWWAVCEEMFNADAGRRRYFVRCYSDGILCGMGEGAR